MKQEPTLVAAVDLGATSVRVAVVDLAAQRPALEVVHRVPHRLVEHADGSLRWDWDRIVREVEQGLAMALERSPLASIGVDGWAVDYGLLGADGGLLSPPFSYRDQRTSAWQDVVAAVGEQRVYEATGIQLMPINTIFQLAAHDREELRRAKQLLMLPDLLVYHLTGHRGTERSNASTTGLLDVSGGGWVPELLASVGVDQALFAPLADAGAHVGSWRGVPVHLVGSHDTASAFIARPGVPTTGSAVVSIGTWVIVGNERSVVDVSDSARMANFSNERGALGGIRFLKNVIGFWLLERCRSAWGDPPIEELVAAAESAGKAVPIFNATDERFLAPIDMEAEIRSAAALRDDVGQPHIVRSILESIAASTADVVASLSEVTGTPVTELHLVGGAVRLSLMNRLITDRVGVPATVGSPEATAIGNAVVQGLAIGRFSSLDDARRWVGTDAARLEPREFTAFLTEANDYPDVS